MDKQSIVIIFLGIITAAWGGWLTYNGYPAMFDSVLMFSAAVGKVGKFRAAISLFVKLIPLLFLVGGSGLLLLKQWGLRLVHTTVFIDIFINLFRIARHCFYWFKPLEPIEISALQYFLDPAILAIGMLFLAELIILNFSMQLKNGLLD
ncbi:MAG: hypothetical protein V1747_01310 [Candidatus Omnitrophota bacterium]